MSLSLTEFQKVKERLVSLGFEDVSSDTGLIEYYADLVFDEITLNINWSTIPDKLHTLYIDMICGEFLYAKYLRGDLDELLKDPNEVNAKATSIKVGDVSVGLSGGSTRTDYFLGLIESLRNPKNKRYLMDIVRRHLT